MTSLHGTNIVATSPTSAKTSTRATSATFLEQCCDVLPSIRFAKQLDAFFDDARLRKPWIASGSLPTEDEDNSQALVADYDRLVHPMLESLLPASVIAQMSASKHANCCSNFLSSTYTTLLTNACMNNACLLGGQFTPLMMYDYLKPVMSTQLLCRSLALCQPNDYISLQSWKSVAENIFLGAIEKSDQDAVSKLLYLPGSIIDVDNLVCPGSDPRPETPVERSARLGHYELTKMLVTQYRADVNKTPFPSSFCKCGQGGVLEALSSRQNSCGNELDVLSDLTATVIGHGGTACTFQVLQGMAVANSPCRRHLSLLKGRSGCWDWMSSGVFHEASFRLDAENLFQMMHLMYQQGLGMESIFIHTRNWGHWAGEIEINVRDEFSATDSHCLPEDLLKIATSRTLTAYEQYVALDPGPYPPAIIDIVAQRGDLRVLMQLTRWRVTYTADTLTAAIRSRNVPAVRFLLASGVAVDCFSAYYRSTPLAEAIRSDLSEVLTLLLRQLDVTQHLNDGYKFCSLLAAAAEMSHWQWIKYLLAMTHMSTSPVLGYALIHAARADQTDVVLALLDAGASLRMSDIQTVFGAKLWANGSHVKYDLTEYPYLIFALWRRNATVVRALLDHRSEQKPPGRYVFLPWLDAVGCAALWHNDHKVIDDLIAAGFLADSGLVMASIIGDRELSNYFLQAQNCFCGLDEALEQAVLKEHFSIARTLLNHGATCLSGHSDNVHKALSSIIYRCPDLLPEFLKPTPGGRGSDIRRDAAIAVLRVLIEAGREDIAQHLIQTERFHEASSVLLLAAIRLRATYKTVELLLVSNVDPNGLTDARGIFSEREHPEPFETLLLAAICICDINLIACLLDSGAEVNQPAIRGLRRTPLQKAAEVGNKAIVEFLISKGADISAPPAVRGGVMSLQAAAMGGYIGIFQLLLKQGEDHREPGARVDGRTALEGAAELGRFDMIVFLLGLGLYSLDQYKSAIGFAEKNGHRAIVGLLSEALQEAQLLTGATIDAFGSTNADTSSSNNVEWALSLSDTSIGSEVMGVSNGMHMIEDNVNDTTDNFRQHNAERAIVFDTKEGDDAQFPKREFVLAFANLFLVTDDHQAAMSIDATDIQIPVQPSVVPTAGAKKFRCNKPHCTFSADRNDTLARHLATHETVQQKRKHTCPHCPGAYSRSDTLKSHLKHCPKKPSGISKG